MSDLPTVFVPLAMLVPRALGQLGYLQPSHAYDAGGGSRQDGRVPEGWIGKRPYKRPYTALLYGRTHEVTSGL